MSDLLTSWADVVLSYLLVGSLTAVALVPLAWAIIKAACIRPAVYHHMIWLYCLIGIAVLPAICLYAPKLTLAVLPARTEVPAVQIFPPINSGDASTSIQSFQTSHIH